MNKNQLKKIILEEMAILEACCAVRMKKTPCAGCVKGGSCESHSSHSGSGHKKHDREGRMTKGNLYHMAKYATKVYDMIDDDDDLPEWLQNKVARAVEKMSSVYHYMDNHVNQPDSIVHLVDAD